MLALGPAVFFLDEIEVLIVEREITQLWVGALPYAVEVEFTPGHAADYLGTGGCWNAVWFEAGAFSCFSGRCCCCGRRVGFSSVPQAGRHGSRPITGWWPVVSCRILGWTVWTWRGNVPDSELLDGIILVQRAVGLPEVNGVVCGCVGGEEAVGSVYGKTKEM